MSPTRHGAVCRKKEIRGLEMDFPLLVLAMTITTYWTTVSLFVLNRRLRHGQSAGVFPRQRVERRLWLLAVPVCAGWIALPWLGLTLAAPGLALPVWATDWAAVVCLRIAAAGVAVVGYLLSAACWVRMGRSWTIAVVPKQDTRLVTAGLYRWVRHPIYALSIVLMLASAVVLPTVPMALLAALHLIALGFKARNEERHLLRHFGHDYARYCEQVGRFCPTWTTPTRRAG
jgi:protein-S-isoprenylcysteine O-methyltransferase Ste14